MWEQVVAALVAAGLLAAIPLIIAFRDTNPIDGVTCNAPKTIKRGQQLELTYIITAIKPTKIAVGTGLYNGDGADESDGDGRIDSRPLKEGENTIKIKLVVSAELQKGRYELVAEVWRENKAGVEGEDTLGEATCDAYQVE
ncbi:hypothetical protein ACQP1W_18870 [Spirillospora sp. CA-255316]